MVKMKSVDSCYLCGKSKFKKRRGKVRDNPSLKILECTSCGLVFLSSFSHISDGFYESSGMHGDSKVDIESWLKDTSKDDNRRFHSLRQLIKNRSVLDFGCGNAGFLIRAKKVAKRAEGVEPEIDLKQHFKREKLRVFSNLDNASGNFDTITLFHVLEHIPDPRTILLALSEKLSKNGQLIIEVPNSNDALLTIYNNREFSRFTYWSCHLFLFNNFTLSMLARQAGLKINYIKQVQRYPLSNHLYWLARGKPGGHQKWDFLDSRQLNAAYEKKLASIGCCDTVLASFSKSHEK
jgi:2-polyprenyl-3-methyl-5-hydroxy-6-metoxy-1,4-benzoquinol methylase